MPGNFSLFPRQQGDKNYSMKYDVIEAKGLDSKLNISLEINNIDTRAWNMTDGSQGLYLAFLENHREFPNATFVMCLYNYTNSSSDNFTCKHGVFDQEGLNPIFDEVKNFTDVMTIANDLNLGHFGVNFIYQLGNMTVEANATNETAAANETTEAGMNVTNETGVVANNTEVVAENTQGSARLLQEVAENASAAVAPVANETTGAKVVSGGEAKENITGGGEEELKDKLPILWFWGFIEGGKPVILKEDSGLAFLDLAKKNETEGASNITEGAAAANTTEQGAAANATETAGTTENTTATVPA
jgi:hypothetical protein